jgi:hypothetical protein
VSPILVRPVREQLEHDRVIRLLQARWRRRYEVAINAGDEKNASIKAGTAVIYPDLVFTAPDGGRRVQGVVEVETGESVNNLEAMAQWAILARTRIPFYLYVPSAALELARRLCADNQVQVTELWTYHAIGDQIRFALAHRTPVEKKPAPSPPRAAPRPSRIGTRRKAASARRPAKRAARAKSAPDRRKAATAKRKRS